MVHQMSFSKTEYSKDLNKSQKASFLETMDRILPWSMLNDIIKEYHSKNPEKAKQCLYPLETMIRIHLLLHWFNLSESDMESELYDSIAMRKFAHLGDLDNSTPNEADILNFRHFLSKYKIFTRFFDEINTLLIENGIQISKGKLVEATIVSLPSTTPK